MHRDNFVLTSLEPPLEGDRLVRHPRACSYTLLWEGEKLHSPGLLMTVYVIKVR